MAFCAFITLALDVESKGTKNVFLVVADVFSVPVGLSTRLEHLLSDQTAPNCWKKVSCKVFQDQGLVSQVLHGSSLIIFPLY